MGPIGNKKKTTDLAFASRIFRLLLPIVTSTQTIKERERTMIKSHARLFDTKHQSPKTRQEFPNLISPQRGVVNWTLLEVDMENLQERTWSCRIVIRREAAMSRSQKKPHYISTTMKFAHLGCRAKSPKQRSRNKLICLVFNAKLNNFLPGD